jgi:hypothetical protein
MTNLILEKRETSFKLTFQNPETQEPNLKIKLKSLLNA